MFCMNCVLCINISRPEAKTYSYKKLKYRILDFGEKKRFLGKIETPGPRLPPPHVRNFFWVSGDLNVIIKLGRFRGDTVEAFGGAGGQERYSGGSQLKNCNIVIVWDLHNVKFTYAQRLCSWAIYICQRMLAISVGLRDRGRDLGYRKRVTFVPWGTFACAHCKCTHAHT